jgi:tRNA (guanine37-N1)-methyltransferase
MKRNPRSFDLLGNIAIVKFPEDFKVNQKKKFAEKLLKEQKSVKTVLEKTGKIKGRLRKIPTKFLAGEKTKEVLYKENKCVFRFNVDTAYFSPRLGNERKEISQLIKKDSDVLVMFAGVAPFSIVIAKNSNAKKVVSVEINREANKYAKLNVELNKVKDKVEIVQGDIKKVAEKFKKKKMKFDIIIMPRPRLKNSFLEQAFILSKNKTKIYYYDFCKIGEEELIIEKIKQEAKNFKKRIKILKVKQAGEIAPYKIRVRVDFQIL